MVENIVTIIAGLLAIGFGAYIFNQIGLGRTLTDSALFVLLGALLLILTASALADHSS